MPELHICGTCRHVMKDPDEKPCRLCKNGGGDGDKDKWQKPPAAESEDVDE